MLLLIILIPLLVILVSGRNGRRRISKFYLINLVVMFAYNLIAWTYILNYLNEGGASLGPGLIMIYVSMLHIMLLVLYMIVVLIIDKVKTTKQKQLESFEIED